MSTPTEIRWTLPGSITIESEADRRVLFLRGDLDAAVVARFKAEQGRAPLVVDAMDAGAVTFISSSGLAIMLRAWEASVPEGRHPGLRASAPCVDKLLRLSGMERVFRPPDQGAPPA
jgi:anti-anti-sigma factor